IYYSFLFHSSRTYRDLTSFPTRRSSDLGEIRLVPDTAHDRNFRGEDRSRDHLLVVGPQVLEAPAASTHEEDIASRVGVRAFDRPDRKSTRLNSSHLGISYAVFCLKKKKK